MYADAMSAFAAAVSANISLVLLSSMQSTSQKKLYQYIKYIQHEFLIYWWFDFEPTLFCVRGIVITSILSELIFELKKEKEIDNAITEYATPVIRFRLR